MSENRLMHAVASNEVKWRNPATDPPPMGVKLLLLTSGGVAIMGGWASNSNLVAWSPLPKRPAELRLFGNWYAWRDAPIEERRMERNDGLNIECSTIEGVALAESPQEAMQKMVGDAVDVMLGQAKESKIDGWHISIIEVEENPHGIDHTVVAIVTMAGVPIFGPVAFPVAWARALHDTLAGALGDYEQRVTLRVQPPANEVPL